MAKRTYFPRQRAPLTSHHNPSQAISTHPKQSQKYLHKKRTKVLTAFRQDSETPHQPSPNPCAIGLRATSQNRRRASHHRHKKQEPSLHRWREGSQNNTRGPHRATRLRLGPPFRRRVTTQRQFEFLATRFATALPTAAPSRLLAAARLHRSRMQPGLHLRPVEIDLASLLDRRKPIALPPIVHRAWVHPQPPGHLFPGQQFLPPGSTGVPFSLFSLIGVVLCPIRRPVCAPRRRIGSRL